MNLLSHITLGLAISESLGLNIIPVLLGTIIPDMDYLTGLTHRTLTHSLLFVIIISLVVYNKNKKNGISLFIGLTSHLLLDVLTTQGIMLAWPIKTFYTYSLFNSLETTPNLFIIIISLIIVWNKDIIRENLRFLGYKKVQIITYSILLIPLILVIPYYQYQIYKCETASLNTIYSDINAYDEECVTLNGLVCSELDSYTSSSNNNYLIFNLCQENQSIKVWMLQSLNQDLNLNDTISITGLFTTKFAENYGYELYMIKKLRKD